MGDAADAILEGLVCQNCGDLMSTWPGFPQSCESCSAKQWEEDHPQPPQGWQFADKPHPTERVGQVFGRASDPSEPDDVEFWYAPRQTVSIRPGETGPEAYQREYGESLPTKIYVCWKQSADAT